MGLEALANMEYPGRFIIIGRSPDQSEPGDMGCLHYNVVIYGITGRSTSSQARRLVLGERKEGIYVQATDKKALEQGNPDLLLYPAMLFTGKPFTHKLSTEGVVVSNGQQTEDLAFILSHSEERSAVSVLEAGHADWTYEPDSPNFTPRISGIVKAGENGLAFGIIKRGIGIGDYRPPVRSYFDVPNVEGKGMLIATYAGQNMDPVPSFSGMPLEVDLPYASAAEAAQAVYDALHRTDPLDLEAKDFRVSVAAVFFISRSMGKDIAIINRHGDAEAQR
jgi:IMP cyclohydrolase